MKARMHKATLLLILGLSSSAMALSPIGPTQAVIGENQWGVGTHTGYQSMDLVADGHFYEYPPAAATRRTKDKIVLEDIESISSFAQIGFGLCPHWDIYGLIGVSDADGDARVKTASPAPAQGFTDNQEFDVDADHELAGGFGTRFTLVDCETVKWGGMAQITWQQPEGGSAWTDSGGGYRTSGNWELDYWELIVAFGPTVVYDNVQFYGGPFIHMVRGDMDFSGTTTDGSRAKTSQDLEEEAMLGGYAGMQMDLKENMLIYVDGQFTGKAWGIGMGTIFRMK
jgi:hypothetical protein